MTKDFMNSDMTKWKHWKVICSILFLLLLGVTSCMRIMSLNESKNTTSNSTEQRK